MRNPKFFALLWQGIEIEIHYVVCWHYIGDGDFISHAEIHSKDRLPLPITHTGYLSHFFASRKELSEEELVGLFRDWLDKEAKRPDWRKEERRQLQLF